MNNRSGNSTEPIDNTLDLSLLNIIPNPVIITNQDLCIRWVNEAFKQLTGFSDAEVEGTQAPYPWWPKAYHKEYLEELKTVRVGGKHKTDWLFETRSGKTFWVKAAAAPVIENGIVKYMLANWVEITDIKTREESLRNELAGLRERYRRTLELVGKIDPKTIALQQKVHSVYQLMAEAEGLLKEIASGRNWQIIISPGLPAVYVDKVLITLVLMSLMETLVKNAGENSTVVIKAEPVTEGVRVIVQTASETENTGMEAADVDETGLKLSRWIIEAHGGRMMVTRVSEKVLKISFTVPVVGVG